MNKHIDETGKTYGRLTVVRRELLTRKQLKAGIGIDYKARWLCRCSCGKTKIISGDALRRGQTQSCGCLQKERVGQALGTHGLIHTAEYHSWIQAKCRCYNTKNQSYRNYGGRGIIMCDQWKNDFMAFFAYIGPRPRDGRYLLDRIDNDGNYEPGNVRWATISESNRNKRHTRNGVQYQPEEMVLYKSIKRIKSMNMYELLRIALKNRNRERRAAIRVERQKN